MKKVILQDGSELEVYEEADVTAVKTQAETEKAALQKTTSDLQAKISELEADDGNRNWAKIRQAKEKLASALKAQGKQVDDDGNVSEAPKVLTGEEIELKASQAARREILGDYKKKALAKLDDETRKVVDHYYNKLTSGEEVTLDNVDKFISEATRLAVPENNNNRGVGSFAGKPPVLKPADGTGFSSTDAGKKIAEEIFGTDSFTKKQ